MPVTVTAGATMVNATSIVIDPKTPANVYAGLDNGHIYKSIDSGGLWNPATSDPAPYPVKALVINQSITTKLFAGTYGGGVYKSITSGVDWSACNGPANLNVLSLVTNSTGALYAGTEAGVFVSTNDCTSWTDMNSGLP